MGNNWWERFKDTILRDTELTCYKELVWDMECYPLIGGDAAFAWGQHVTHVAYVPAQQLLVLWDIVGCYYSLDPFLTRCPRRISTRNNYFVLVMRNTNAILTRTKRKLWPFFRPLTVLNEPPVEQHAGDVLRCLILIPCQAAITYAVGCPSNIQEIFLWRHRERKLYFMLKFVLNTFI